MTSRQRHASIFLFLLLILQAADASAQPPSDALSILAPLAGRTWSGRMTSPPDRSFDYRNTWEIKADGTVIDRWFQNAFGDWRPGHVVELRPREGR